MHLKVRDFTLLQAATWLGISRFVLVRELEKRGALQHDEFGIRPPQDFINRGLLRLETRGTYIDGRRLKHYHHTTLTLRGLAWIADELEAVAKAS